MVKRKTRKVSKPIGSIKQGKVYKLVFGSRTKPRIGKKSFRTKKSLNTFVGKKYNLKTKR